MTSAEMELQFDRLYDKITNFDAPGYTQEEKSAMLTKAQERIFFKYYGPFNKTRESFEETEARRKELKELVKGTTITVPSTSQTNVLPNGVFYDLPEDCLFVIQEQATTVSQDPCKNNKRIKVRPITHDEYNIMIDNPFKKPDVNRYAYRLDYQGQKHEIVTDGTYTIGQYHIRYIERLQPIITGSFSYLGVAGPLDCKLDSSVHERIVDEAVIIATGITEPEFYQLKTIEQQKSE